MKTFTYIASLMLKSSGRNSQALNKTLMVHVSTRLDMHIEVPRVDYEKLSGDRVGSRVHQYAHESKPQEIFSTSDFRITDLPTSLVMPICVWRSVDNSDFCKELLTL